MILFTLVLVLVISVITTLWKLYQYIGFSDPIKDPDYEWALNLLTKHGKTFRFALNFLPMDRRKHIVCYYAFCRLTDDMIDESEHPEENLHILEKFYDKVYESWDQYTESSHDIKKNIYNESEKNIEDFLMSQKLSEDESRALKIFHQIIYEKNIERKYSELLLKGYAQDVKNHEIKTIEDLIRYCVYVAGSIGMIICHLFDIRDPETLESANIYGSALQITNISRDILTDSELKKIYVPTEILMGHGITRQNLLDICKNSDESSNNQKILKISKQLVNLAENYYIVGSIGAMGKPRGIKIAFFLAGIIYRQIGVKIKSQNTYIKRTYVSKWEKLMTVFKGIYYYNYWTIIGTKRNAPMPIHY